MSYHLGETSVTSTFRDITANRVLVLRNSDPAIAQIVKLAAPMSFDWLRDTFRHDHGVKDSLDWGKAILSDVAQLDQYLHTYGLMVNAQWREFTKNFEFAEEPLRVIDYGCGQGLAAVALSDRFGAAFRKSVKEVVLIEPSESALIRAESVYRNVFSKAKTACLTKKLDDLKKADFSTSSFKTLHIFSNILDIDSFDLSALFNRLLTSGDHIVLAVSHNRDFAGGAGRVRGIKEEVGKADHVDWIKVHESAITEFTCGDGGKFSVIGWVANLRIKRG